MKYYEICFHLKAPKDLFEDARFVLTALVGEAGLEAFSDTSDGMVGYVQQQLFNSDLLNEQVSSMPFPDVVVSYEIAEAEDKDWNEQWEREGFEPIIINNKVVIHDGRHVSELEVTPDKTIIEIDTKQAFGTGNHETTRLMIQQLLKLDLDGCHLLDCGTGTGILSIAALKLGASKAVGYDIDEWSSDNARHNAVINGVDSRFVSLLGNAQQVLPTLQDKFDVVVANINRNILLTDMPLFVEHMATHATLLLSGFYRQDLPILEEKAHQLSLVLVDKTNEGDWQCVRFHSS